MHRQAQLPQVISAADYGGAFPFNVEVLLDGRPIDAVWTRIDTASGVGERYSCHVDGSPVVISDENGMRRATEAVHGTFEFRWRDDRASPARPDQG